MSCARWRRGSAEGSRGSQETSMTCTTASPPACSFSTSMRDDATLATRSSASLTFPSVIVCSRFTQQVREANRER